MKQLRRIAFGLIAVALTFSLFGAMTLIVGMLNDLGAWLASVAPLVFHTPRDGALASAIAIFILTLAFVLGYLMAKDGEPAEPPA